MQTDNRQTTSWRGSMKTKLNGDSHDGKRLLKEPFTCRMKLGGLPEVEVAGQGSKVGQNAVD